MSLNNFLFRNEVRKRIANQLYVYIIHLVHLILNVMPGFIRNVCFCALLRKAGRHVFFDYNIYIKFPWLVEMGDNVSINRGVEFYPDYAGRHKIVLGSGVYVAPHVRFYAAGHDLSDFSQHQGGEIKVGNQVWIGAGAIILPGVYIADGSVVGAGSVVTKDVPPNTVVAGIPGREIKSRPE
ncbi:acyltransferase [Candidatus Omnitrophota bacterium]